jgi:hypothetical protein
MMKQGGPNAEKYLYEALTETGATTLLYGDTNNSVVERIFELDPSLRDRAGHMDDIASIAKDVTKPLARSVTIGGKRVTWQDMVAAQFWWIRSNDMATVIPLWKAAFNQASQEGIGMTEGMTEAEREAKAVEYAKAVVRRTQPQTLAIDRTAWQTDESMRSLMMFMTYQVTMANNIMSTMYGQSLGSLSGAKLAQTVAANITAPALTMALSSFVWSQLWDDEDVQQSWSDLMLNFMMNNIQSAVAPIILARDIPSALRYGPRSLTYKPISTPYKIIEDLVTPDSLGDFTYAAIQAGGYYFNVNIQNLIGDGIKAYNAVTEDEEK